METRLRCVWDAQLVICHPVCFIKKNGVALRDEYRAGKIVAGSERLYVGVDLCR